MKFEVNYQFAGFITVNAENTDEALGIVQNMWLHQRSKLLKVGHFECVDINEQVKKEEINEHHQQA